MLPSGVLNLKMQLRDRRTPTGHGHWPPARRTAKQVKVNNAFLLTEAVGGSTWATVVAEADLVQLKRLTQKKRRPCFNLKQSLIWKSPILTKL